jgi:prefoldin subunit 5
MNNQGEIERSIGRIEGKVDEIIRRLERMNGSVDKHEQRLNLIDQEIARSKGIAAGISFVISTISAIIAYLLKNK